MKIYGKRIHFGRKVKKSLGIKNNWFSRALGVKKQRPVSSAGQIVNSGRRLSQIA